MQNVELRYSPISEEHQINRTRIQLVGGAVCVILGLMETYPIFTGPYILVPAVGMIIAFVSILVARFYKQFLKKYGHRIESIVLFISGVTMCITGLGFHIQGSRYLPFAYYFITLLYFIILPFLWIPARKNSCFLDVTDTGLTVHRLMFRTRIFSWQQIESIKIKDTVFYLKSAGRKKRKFYIPKTQMSEYTQMIQLLEKIKKKHTFSIIK